jgi:hypothetical protein
MNEYLTWIASDKTLALFFGRIPASQFDRIRSHWDAIIETIQIP